MIKKVWFLVYIIAGIGYNWVIDSDNALSLLVSVVCPCCPYTVHTLCTTNLLLLASFISIISIDTNHVHTPVALPPPFTLSLSPLYSFFSFFPHLLTKLYRTVKHLDEAPIVQAEDGIISGSGLQDDSSIEKQKFEDKLWALHLFTNYPSKL